MLCSRPGRCLAGRLLASEVLCFSPTWQLAVRAALPGFSGVSLGKCRATRPAQPSCAGGGTGPGLPGSGSLLCQGCSGSLSLCQSPLSTQAPRLVDLWTQGQGLGRQDFCFSFQSLGELRFPICRVEVITEG